MLNFLLSILSGILLFLSFPKFDFTFLVWIALVPFFIAISNCKSIKSAFFCGWLCGIVFFGGLFFWVNILRTWVGSLAHLGWVLLIIYQGFYFGLFSVIVKFLIRRWELKENRVGDSVGQASRLLTSQIVLSQARTPDLPFDDEFSLASAENKFAKILIISFFWIILEIIRGAGPYGINIGQLGYTQYMNLPMIQSAAFFTVYGISFLIVMFNVAVASIFFNQIPPRPPFLKGEMKQHPPFLRGGWGGLIPLIISILLIFVNYGYGLYVLNSSSVVPARPAGGRRPSSVAKIAIIQGNISQDQKMDPRFYEANEKIYFDLTKEALKFNPQLIIWPETVLVRGIEPVRKQIQDILASRHPELISGSNDFDKQVYLLTGAFSFINGKGPYNSVVCINSSGDVTGSYNKYRLMPFGEVLPFRFLIGRFFGNVDLLSNDLVPADKLEIIKIPEENRTSHVARRTSLRNFGIAICFESTFPKLIGKMKKLGAEAIFVVTNDAWFFNSAAGYQHFSVLPFRAVESRSYVVQAANSGISAIIDPCGRIVEQSEVNEKTVLIGEIKAY